MKKMKKDNGKKERKHEKKKRRKKKRKDAEKATTSQRPSTPAKTHDATPTRKTQTFMSYCETFTNQELLAIV